MGMGTACVGMGAGWGQHMRGWGGNGDNFTGMGWGWGCMFIPVSIFSSHPGPHTWKMVRENSGKLWFACGVLVQL